LFVLFYVLLYIGIPINFHYCHGELEKVSVFLSKDVKCCCPVDMNSSKCCRNEHFVLKAINDEQNIVYNNFIITFDETAIVYNIEHSGIIFQDIPNFEVNCNSPPSYISKYILNCELIFYG